MLTEIKRNHNWGRACDFCDSSIAGVLSGTNPYDNAVGLLKRYLKIAGPTQILPKSSFCGNRFIDETGARCYTRRTLALSYGEELTHRMDKSHF